MIIQQRFTILALSLLGALALAACGGSGPATTGGDAPQAATAAPPGSQNPVSPSQIPQACALLSAANVEKITGYGGGIADSQALDEGATNCSILAGQGKFKVEVGVGKAIFPVLPSEKKVELEGGAKGIVRDSGIGQGWMSLVEFPDYTVTLLVGGLAAKLDPDKKVASVTAADGSTMTYEQVYEAIAHVIAHNAATGAHVPSSVSDVDAKDDPCALLTLDDLKQVMTDFTITEPESSPSVYGGNKCLFRGHSDSLKATAMVGVVYLTHRQFEQLNSSGSANRTDIGGVSVYDLGKGFGTLLNKGDRYVRLSIDINEEDSSALDQLAAAMQAWMPQLAAKIAPRIGR